MNSAAATFELIGVGSPIMDLLAPVPDAFLAQVAGAKSSAASIRKCQPVRASDW